jgi:hypothetical protein
MVMWMIEAQILTFGVVGIPGISNSAEGSIWPNDMLKTADTVVRICSFMILRTVMIKKTTARTTAAEHLRKDINVSGLTERKMQNETNVPELTKYLSLLDIDD